MSKIISIVTPRKSTNVSIDKLLWGLWTVKAGEQAENIIKEKAKEGMINSSTDAKLFILSQIVEEDIYKTAQSKKLLRKN